MSRRTTSSARRRAERLGLPTPTRYASEPSVIHAIDEDQSEVERLHRALVDEPVDATAEDQSEDVGAPVAVDDRPDAAAVELVEAEDGEYFRARPLRQDTGWLDREPPARRPVIHPALREPQALAASLRDRAWHWSKFHGARMFGPHEWTIACHMSRGLARAVPGVVRWAADFDGKELVDIAKDKGENRDAALHRADHKSTVYRRTAGLSMGAAGFVTSPLWVDALTSGLPWWMNLGGLGAAGGWLAWFGRPDDGTPFLAKAADAEDSPAGKVITDVMIREAFVDAGLARDNDPESVTFAEPPTRVLSGTQGWDCVVVLPGSKTALDAIKAEVRIASGLDIDESRLFLDRVRGSQGSARRVAVFVAKDDPMSAPPHHSPLINGGAVDLFQSFPFGRSPRGEEFRLAMLSTNVLIAAQPGLGKTFVARLIAAAAALDPHVQMFIFDGKGGADWLALEKVAHRIGIGARDVIVKLLLKTLEELKEEMERRYERLQHFRRKGMIRESKITPAIAKNPGHNMPLSVLVIDEFQEYLEHDLGGQIEDLLINISRRGRALGIHLVLATQRPGSDTINTKLRSNCHIRLCGRVDDIHAAKMVLGDIAPGTASPMRIERHQKGAMVIKGASDDNASAQFDGTLLRVDYADDDHIDAIIDRALSYRRKADTVTGAAAGEQPEEDVPARLLDDVIAVFRTGEDKTWSSNLAARLAAQYPKLYSGWNADVLGKNLRNFKPEGWPKKKAWPHAPRTKAMHGTPDDPATDEGTSSTRMGIVLADVLRAHRELAGDPPADEEAA